MAQRRRRSSTAARSATRARRSGCSSCRPDPRRRRRQRDRRARRVGGETNLAGMPALTDPGEPVGPAAGLRDPLPEPAAGVTAWDKAFGNFSAGAGDRDRVGRRRDHARLHARTRPRRASSCSRIWPASGSAWSASRSTCRGTIVQRLHVRADDLRQLQCERARAAPARSCSTTTPPRRTRSGRGAGQRPPGPASWMVSASGAQGCCRPRRAPSQLLFNTPFTFVTGTGAADAGAARARQTRCRPRPSPTRRRWRAASPANQLRREPSRCSTRRSSPVTPRNQLTDPSNAFLQAALVAHSHGLLLIGAPSLNVVKATAPHLKAIKRTSKFLQRRIAAAAARYSDVYVIQAQSLERKPSRFSAFVRQAAAQAVNAHRIGRDPDRDPLRRGHRGPDRADARTGPQRRRLVGLGLRADRPSSADLTRRPAATPRSG